MKSIKFLSVVLALVLCSCTTQPTNQELHAFEGETILVIPPVSKDSKVGDSVGRSLTDFLITEAGTDVRYAGDVPKLNSIMSRDNLFADGQINMGEVTRIGKAVNAHEVVCVTIKSVNPYPPQKMSALVIVRNIDGDRYRQKVSYVTVDMKNPMHKKEFADFAGGSLRGPLGDRFVKKTNVNAEAALLSNDEFSKYVGYKIAKSILLMKKY